MHWGIGATNCHHNYVARESHYGQNVLHLDSRGVIVAASIIAGVGTAYVLTLLPEWLGRLLLFFFTHTMYSVKAVGRDNFPEKTGALLVRNHMSFVDALLLRWSASLPRVIARKNGREPRAPDIFYLVGTFEMERSLRLWPASRPIVLPSSTAIPSTQKQHLPGASVRQILPG